MKFVVLFMTKQFAGTAAHSPSTLARRKAPGQPPGKLRTWAGAIPAELARRGHDATFICLETEAYVRSVLGGGAGVVRYSIAPRFEALWTSRGDVARECLEAADAILTRDAYRKYGELFAGFRIGDRPVVAISTAGKFRSQFLPSEARLTILVNSDEERAETAPLGFPCEVFRKPAYDLFYEIPADPPPKVYDAAFVTWTTATERKRFDLVLDALVRLRAAGERSLSLVVAGDSSPHAGRIESELGPPGRIVVHRAGRVGREELRDLFQRTRVTVVASNKDANPQVIAESLACNVPVACAADITGGAFQINRSTGELFTPTPEGLAATLVSMLDRIDQFDAHANCITIDESADQIERIVGSRGSAAAGA